MLDALSSFTLFSLIPFLLPIFLAIAGWCMIKLVRLLALNPRTFRGLKPVLGWQGYFYNKQDQYVTDWSRGLLERLGGLQQIFELIGPERVVTHELHYLRPQIDSILDNVMLERNAVLWENLPILVKNRFYARAHRLLPRIIDDIVEELGDGLNRTLTYKRLLHYAEKQKPGTLLAIYNILSRNTFNSMARFCAWLGFILGCIQVLVAAFTGAGHLLFWSVWGAFSVFFFFWLCQHWIGYPYKPLRIRNWQIRSPYAKFRETQDRELANLLAHDVLCPRNLYGTLLFEGRTHHSHALIRKQLLVLVEDVSIRSIVQLTLGPIGYLELKNTLSEKLTDAIIEPFLDESFNQERSGMIAAFLVQRLTDIEDRVYYDTLKRILSPLSVIAGIGGFWIGAMAGTAQWLLIQLL